MSKYQVPARSKRCGASGYCRPVPDQVGSGTVRSAPVSVSIRERAMPPRPEKCTQQLPSLSQAKSGSMPGTGTRMGSDQGPLGSSLVTRIDSAPVEPTLVVMIQNRPS